MATQSPPRPPMPTTVRADTRTGLAGGIALVALVLGLVVVAVNARSGAVAERIRNPKVQGAPRPVAPLWGFDHWLVLHQIGSILMMVTLIAVFVVAWRRYPRHPILLMVLVLTLLIWQDPIMNWAPYAVYNPQLWHWPETWGLVSLSPTVEPFIVIGYATFYLAPFFPAVWLLRRLQLHRPPDAFVWRHPLVSLSLLIFAIGFVFDALLEMFLIRTQLYIYSQVVPFGSIAAGKWYQFPLIWESSLVTLVMIPAGVLLYRDDTGRTQAEKLAHRIRAFRTRPALVTFIVMFIIINVAYFCYGGSYAVLRVANVTTSVACPWPFPEAKVYDPNGYYERNGQPGPYSAGIWSGWESGQPSGRPKVTTPSAGGRCGTGNG
jgi:Spirocyclase AveC-like